MQLLKVCEIIVVKSSLGAIRFEAPLKPILHPTTAVLGSTRCHVNQSSFTPDTNGAQSSYF